MQYKPETDKVAMMAIPYTPVIQSISPIDDPQIQRTRRILSIILGICLVNSFGKKKQFFLSIFYITLLGSFCSQSGFCDLWIFDSTRE